MAEPALHERDLKGLVWLWGNTVRQARRTVTDDQTGGRRARVRLRSVTPLRNPVFVLGCPRSGTTYLGTLLEASPDVSYYFEPPLFKYLVRLMYERNISRIRAAGAYRLMMRSLLLIAPGSGPRIVEKNPNHVFAAERLHEIFPDAKFVVITRDGRDVALSLSEKPWHRADSVGSGLREPAGYLYGPHPHFYIEPERRAEYEATSDVHRCIWIWRRHQEEVERLRTALPADVQHHLRYEDLIQDSDRTLHELLAFLDVDDQAAQAVLRKASTGRSDSIRRWAASLSDDDLAIIETEAGELLAQLDYA